jgi:hypothetical protein
MESCHSLCVCSILASKAGMQREPSLTMPEA